MRGNTFTNEFFSHLFFVFVCDLQGRWYSAKVLTVTDAIPTSFSASAAATATATANSGTQSLCMHTSAHAIGY
jgi:hypothetical protein